jgi:hypothetical protein
LNDKGAKGRLITSLRHELLEIIEAVLLAAVAIATAWSGYQAARWDGRQAHSYGLSSKYRLMATQASTRSGQQLIYDTTTFDFWLQSATNGDVKAKQIFERRFRLEYRPAFAAWLRTDPFHNPHAPPGPSFMPQYRNAEAARSAQFEARATAAFETGTLAREQGDEYVRDTVLLATVLFLTAIAQRFKSRAMRIVLLGVSGALLVLALSLLETYSIA